MMEDLRSDAHLPGVIDLRKKTNPIIPLGSPASADTGRHVFSDIPPVKTVRFANKRAAAYWSPGIRAGLAALATLPAGLTAQEVVDTAGAAADSGPDVFGMGAIGVLVAITVFVVYAVLRSGSSSSATVPPTRTVRPPTTPRSGSSGSADEDIKT